ACGYAWRNRNGRQDRKCAIAVCYMCLALLLAPEAHSADVKKRRSKHTNQAKSAKISKIASPQSSSVGTAQQARTSSASSSSPRRTQPGASLIRDVTNDQPTFTPTPQGSPTPPGLRLER